ncbi:MAG: hypothetical protein Q7T20_19480 [Saprospiraceae bacterium]|nr:hypothetical protein [Saprospiraceae bacterium]
MEENIHDDKLDDYVRKSFEGHEEAPASDMWSRVERELLPPSAVPVPHASYLRYGWQALAAAVILILFSTLVCEHLYYEEKLRLLTEKASGTQLYSAESNRLEEEKGSSPVSKSIVPTPTQNADPVYRSSAPSNLKEIQDTRTEPILDRTPMVVRSQTSTEPNSVPLNSPESIDIVCLPTLESRIEGLKPDLPVLSLIPIQPLREASGWYLGVQSSLLASMERSRTPMARPGRPAFSSKQESAGISSIWWFKTGKMLNERFSLESGIGYQNSTRTATHTPRFRFGDGTHQGPGLRRTFNYDLSTYGGTAEVSLRMDETSGSPAPDDEPVALKITTSEQTELLRIPLLAGYRFGSGRLQGQVKVGLLGNIIVKNQLDISARVSENARFKPVSGREGYTVQLSQKKLILGYWMSAGAEFRLNRQLSLVAETALTGDFPRNDHHSRRLPDRLLLGLNVGVNYYF